MSFLIQLHFYKIKFIVSTFWTETPGRENDEVIASTAKRWDSWPWTNHIFQRRTENCHPGNSCNYIVTSWYSCREKRSAALQGKNDIIWLMSHEVHVYQCFFPKQYTGHIIHRLQLVLLHHLIICIGIFIFLPSWCRCSICSTSVETPKRLLNGVTSTRWRDTIETRFNIRPWYSA